MKFDPIDNPRTITSTGRWWYPLHPERSDIVIADIAAGLANKARYGGQTIPGCYYSVAQHSCFLARHAMNKGDYDLALEFMIHDGCEAYLGLDYPRPVKHLFRDGLVLEELADRAIRNHFGIPEKMSKECKDLDGLITIDELEAYTAKPRDGSSRNAMGEKRRSDLFWDLHRQECWTPNQARERFLTMYFDIQHVRMEQDRE